MKLLQLFAFMFIDAVGITDLSIEEQGRAALCIGSLLAATILLLCAISSLALPLLHIGA